MNFLADAGVVALIIALVSGIKVTGVPSRFSPLISLAAGVIFYGSFPVGNFQTNILYGIIAGLTASGFYSGARTVIDPTKEQKDSRNVL